MRYWLVMPAAGAGQRFGAGVPKQYAPLAGRTVLEWALEPFLADPRCAQAVVALAEHDTQWPHVDRRLRAAADPARAPLITARGGAQRSLSVRNALAALQARARPHDWVLVHDGARPCLESLDLERLLERLAHHPVGGLLAARATDTLKEAGADPLPHPEVVRTLERAALWRALTPQMFRYGPLCAALDQAHAAGRFPSDEAQALEWTGARAALVQGSAGNLKITSGEDLTLAEALLGMRGNSGGARGNP